MTARRADSSGWKPKPGSRVRLRPHPKALDDEPPPPPGVWCVIDRAPGHMQWWVQATDLEAKAWAVTHSSWSGCVAIDSKLMDPVNAVRL